MTPIDMSSIRRTLVRRAPVSFLLLLSVALALPPADARAQTLIADDLVSPNYAVDFNTTGTYTASSPSTLGRWEAMVSRPAAGPGPSDTQVGAYAALWNRGDSAETTTPPTLIGPLAVGRARSFLLREGLWISSLTDSRLNLIGNTPSATTEPLQPPSLLTTPCTPLGSCPDSPCEPVTAAWSLTELPAATTATAARNPSLFLLYNDYYWRDTEESSLVGLLNPRSNASFSLTSSAAVLNTGNLPLDSASCTSPTLLTDTPGEHINAVAACAADSLWVVSRFTPVGGAPVLSMLRLQPTTATLTEESSRLTAALSPGSSAYGTFTASRSILSPESSLRHDPSDPDRSFHAVGATTDTAKAVWCGPDGVHLADLTTGETLLLSAEPASRPAVAVTASGTVAAWETEDHHVRQWKNGTLSTVDQAQRPLLEKNADDQVTLFYLRPNDATTWSLHAQPVQ